MVERAADGALPTAKQTFSRLDGTCGVASEAVKYSIVVRPGGESGQPGVTPV